MRWQGIKDSIHFILKKQAGSRRRICKERCHEVDAATLPRGLASDPPHSPGKLWLILCTGTRLPHNSFIIAA